MSHPAIQLTRGWPEPRADGRWSADHRLATAAALLATAPSEATSHQATSCRRQYASAVSQPAGPFSHQRNGSRRACTLFPRRRRRPSSRAVGAPLSPPAARGTARGRFLHRRRSWQLSLRGCRADLLLTRRGPVRAAPYFSQSWPPRPASSLRNQNLHTADVSQCDSSVVPSFSTPSSAAG